MNCFEINQFVLIYIKYTKKIKGTFVRLTFNNIAVGLTVFQILGYFLEPKKTWIEMLLRSVQFSARELRPETISSIFG